MLLYRLSPQRKQALEFEVQSMLHSNVIEERNSPYAAPEVMVPKKDGRFSVCTNYRKLNSVIVPDRDVLYAAQQKRYICKYH